MSKHTVVTDDITHHQRRWDRVISHLGLVKITLPPQLALSLVITTFRTNAIMAIPVFWASMNSIKLMRTSQKQTGSGKLKMVALCIRSLVVIIYLDQLIDTIG